jgi:hypothetical protein
LEYGYIITFTLKKLQSEMYENDQATIKNMILWTPLLTPFAKMDTFGPKRPGFLLYGERTDTGDYRVTFLWPLSVYRCGSPSSVE